MLDFPGMSVLREYAIAAYFSRCRIFLVLISVIFPRKLAFSTARRAREEVARRRIGSLKDDGPERKRPVGLSGH